jgi:hypothetical protein
LPGNSLKASEKQEQSRNSGGCHREGKLAGTDTLRERFGTQVSYNHAQFPSLNSSVDFFNATGTVDRISSMTVGVVADQEVTSFSVLP